MSTRYKRLSPPNWCDYGEETFKDGKHDILATDRAPIVPVVMGRDGWYYDRKEKRTWIEYKGIAYAYNDVGMLKYEIDVVFPNTLPRPSVISALLVLEKEHLLSPEQKHQLEVLRSWIQLRDIRLDGTRHCMRAMRRLGL